MEPSSGQNSSRNGNDSQVQTSPEEETQENDPAAPEETPENTSAGATEGAESNAAPADESHPNVSDVEQGTTSEAISTETDKENSRTLGTSRQPLPVVLTFAARGRPRQPFFGGPPAEPPGPPSTSTGRQGIGQTGRLQAQQNVPPPPSYYPSRRVHYQTVDEQPETQTRAQTRAQAKAQAQAQAQAQSHEASRRNEHQYVFSDAVNPMLNPMVNPFTNIVAWAPYPTKISPGIPSYLAHLVEAEVVFVVQHLEAIEIFGSLDLPNVYFIQNDKGEAIYYVYETTVCIPCCCRNSRALQLHVNDIYQNEVIYMKKSCGCALYFCCFPFLEVYSPPSVPIGAVVKKYHPCREQFHILDADENLIFKIYGDCSLMYCSRCIQYDFTIRALDPNETEVGFIRRDFPGMYQFLLGTEYYGVSFPVDLDVRMKAVFLGALFLIDFLYFE